MFVIVSKQAEYAVCALVELARLEPSGSLQTRLIAEKHGIPETSLEQVMVRLRRQGLLQSYRGAQGGYSLAHRPDKACRLSEVLGAFLPLRAKNDPPSGMRRGVLNWMQRVEDAAWDEANGKTLADLARDCQDYDDALALMPGL